MHTDFSDWHNPKVASVLGLDILNFSQVWNESSLIWWNIAVFHWHAEPKLSLGQLTTSVSSSLFALNFCGNTHQRWLLTQCGILLSSAGGWLMFWNCQTSSKTGFPLVPPYLIISDSWTAFHFHCVNPGNPSAPNDQLVKGSKGTSMVLV